MTNLTLGTSAIRELDGLYSLNDLHRASGGEAKNKPAFFLRLDQTTALIAEIQRVSDSQLALKVTHGNAGGTYACRELVIAYAAWISAAFHLKVIRVFLDATAPAAPALPDARINENQAGEIATLIAERFPEGRHRPYAWGRFNNHFRIARYRELPAAKFADACAYIRQMPQKGQTLPAPSDDRPKFTLLNRRWIVYFDENGIECAKQIPSEAGVFTPDDIIAYVSEPGGFPVKQMHKLLSAVTCRLTTIMNTNYQGSAS